MNGEDAGHGGVVWCGANLGGLKNSTTTFSQSPIQYSALPPPVVFVAVVRLNRFGVSVSSRSPLKVNTKEKATAVCLAMHIAST
ncbi:unnamed protein product [Urochloa humidicola]